jgi:hypothetical protein
MAFLACLIIGERKLTFILVFYCGMGISRNIIMAGFALDPNGTMYGMIKVILRNVKRKDLAAGKGHAQSFVAMAG